MKTARFSRHILSIIKTAFAMLALATVTISCTAGDQGSEKVPDSVGMDTTGNQNPTAVGEAGPSIPADTAAAGNEPKPGAN